MQTLDVISINIWQILISLCNLLILFFILKRFLYNPVKKVFAERQNALDSQYAAAADAKNKAESDRKTWEEKLQGAQSEADDLIKKAASDAERRSDQIVSDAKERAEGIIKDAKAQAVLEQKKAQSKIKKEIVDVSAALTEKMLNREINTEDHREIIDSVIAEIGEDDDGIN